MDMENRIGRGEVVRPVGGTVKIGDREFQLSGSQVEVLRALGSADGVISAASINEIAFGGKMENASVASIISLLRRTTEIPDLIVNRRGEGYYLGRDVTIGEATLLGKEIPGPEGARKRPQQSRESRVSTAPIEVFNRDHIEKPKEPFRYSIREVARMTEPRKVDPKYYIGKIDAFKEARISTEEILNNLGVDKILAFLAHSEYDLASRLGSSEDEIRKHLVLMLEDDIVELRRDLIQLQLALPQMKGTSREIYVLTDHYRKELIEQNSKRLSRMEGIQRNLLERAQVKAEQSQDAPLPESTQV